MTRKSTFTQHELTKAIKGALDAGLSIAKVRASSKGIEIITPDGTDHEGKNTWDDLCDDEKK